MYNLPTSEEELLKKWHKRIRETQFDHYASEMLFSKINLALGVPVIVLSTIVGTSVFATLEESVDVRLQILVGITSMTSAVLAGIQTFLRSSERAEKHRLIAARYGAIRREIEQIVVLPRDAPGDVVKYLTSLRARIDALAEEAPAVPLWARRHAESIRNAASKDRIADSVPQSRPESE